MNSSVTSLGEACSSWEMAGRIGSTRPMPMNDTTHASATAKTAFGCRNGLTTEPAWVPLMRCSPSGVWFRRYLGPRCVFRANVPARYQYGCRFHLL